ncbi:hypothetical protein GCM10028832_25040 [Streptomyces sparsus]
MTTAADSAAIRTAFPRRKDMRSLSTDPGARTGAAVRRVGRPTGRPARPPTGGASVLPGATREGVTSGAVRSADRPERCSVHTVAECKEARTPATSSLRIPQASCVVPPVTGPA